MRFTPTLAVILVAGIATGIALFRPGPSPEPQAAGAAVAQADDGPVAAPGPAPDEAALEISGFAFPAELVVSTGATITVTNTDAAPHTVVADDGSFATDTIGTGDSIAFTAPTAPGTYDYQCSIHPSMTARLVVQQ